MDGGCGLLGRSRLLGAVGTDVDAAARLLLRDVRRRGMLALVVERVRAVLRAARVPPLERADDERARASTAAPSGKELTKPLRQPARRVGRGEEFQRPPGGDGVAARAEAAGWNTEVRDGCFEEVRIRCCEDVL